MTPNLSAPGRVCPLDYQYQPAVLAAAPAQQADHVYVIGGLYGNVEALQAIEAMRDAEAALGRHVSLIFNGDAHWFDIDPKDFSLVAEAVESHTGCSGNVEVELARIGEGVGCGCAYPDFVDDDEVQRSNRIIARLRQTANQHVAHLTHLRALPRLLRLSVGGIDIGVVHGDAWSLAGWGFSQQALRQAQHADRPSADNSLQVAWTETSTRVLCSSHSCLPAAVELPCDGQPRVLMNNGAAGMPNFRNTHFGVITRLSTCLQVPHNSLYGTTLDGLRIDAVPVPYDHAAWCARFQRHWPHGSDAHTSYWARITSGPSTTIDDALFGAFALRHAGRPRPLAGPGASHV